MNDNEYNIMMKSLKKLHAEVCSSKESAQAFLHKLGTHNTDGTLTKLYGGEYTIENGVKNFNAEEMQPTMGPKDPRPFGGLIG